MVDTILDPVIKLGTSTTKADPSGDYAWIMFERIERQGRSGAFQALGAKALQLTGVSAEYGVVTLLGAATLAERFVAFLVGPSGQAILAHQGFAPG